MVLTIRKSDGFRKHCESAPKMAAPRLEMLLKILFLKNKSYQQKQNQLLKLDIAQTMGLTIRKSDGFRKHCENAPKMAAPRLEMNTRYLWCHDWWAFESFWEIIGFVSRIFWSLLTKQCVNEMKTLICGLEMSKYSHEGLNHRNQAKIWSE